MAKSAEPRVSWLCETAADRERVVDMERRIKPLRVWSFAVLASALLISGPWVGFWTVLPLALAGLAFSFTDRKLETSARPEYRMALAWLISEVAIAASVALSGGPRSAGISWLALPVVTLAARFSTRGVAAGGGLAAVFILAATFGVDPAFAAAHPQNEAFPLALLAGVAFFSVALMRSDLQHRSASVIDPLTSMLNRNALVTRVAELEAQAGLVRQPVGLIVCDVDHFKMINDEHGHSVGDAVLRDIAYRLRKRLRAFDLAYRLGGEEFLVILPGADASQVASIAESLREAIEAEGTGGIGGIGVTMSFGVSASGPGSFDYDATFFRADAALYEAKSAGRNRVCVSYEEMDMAQASPSSR